MVWSFVYLALCRLVQGRCPLPEQLACLRPLVSAAEGCAEVDDVVRVLERGAIAEVVVQRDAGIVDVVSSDSACLIPSQGVQEAGQFRLPAVSAGHRKIVLIMTS